jgi:gamma-glutamylcyclotransferase (GGCT)/AIG2-like uncharacterized protein YtfP
MGWLDHLFNAPKEINGKKKAKPMKEKILPKPRHEAPTKKTTKKEEIKDMLYFAYGSNLDPERMKERCPSAQVIGSGALGGYRLTFTENNAGKIVANIEEHEGSQVWGTIFHIEEADRKVLDKCEGHPNVYERTPITLKFRNEPLKVQTYIMPAFIKNKKTVEVKKGFYTDGYEKVRRGYGVPEEGYLEYIIRGYKHFRFDLAVLQESLKYSMDATPQAEIKPKEEKVTEVINTASTKRKFIGKGSTGKHLVFVYGTLKKGYHNHRLLEGSTFVENAWIEGEIYDLPFGFPAVKKGEGEVRGEIYEVDAITKDRLDGLESYDERRDEGMYLRRPTIAHSIKADYAVEYYLWNRPIPDGAVLLESGEPWKPKMFKREAK